MWGTHIITKNAESNGQVNGDETGTWFVSGFVYWTTGLTLKNVPCNLKSLYPPEIG